MLVGELIIALQQYDPSTEVSIIIAANDGSDGWDYSDSVIAYPSDVTDSENFDPGAVGSSPKVEIICDGSTSHPYGRDI